MATETSMHGTDPDSRGRGRGTTRKHLVFEATFSCNYDCLYCYNAWKNDRPYPASGRLSTETTKRLLAKAISETGARLVSMSGGEPLLRPDIWELVSHIGDLGVEVNMITNGSLVSRQVAQRARHLPISLWEVPILAGRAEVHDAMTRSPGSFDASCRALVELKDADQVVVAVLVLTKMNAAQAVEAMEVAFALGADGLMLNRFNPGGEGCRNADILMPEPEVVRKVLDQAERLAVEYELPVSCSIAMPPCLFDHARWPHLGFGFCAAGTEDAYEAIDPVGNVRPCNHSMTILGNLMEQSFSELVSSPKMKEFLEARPGFCSGCVLERTCQGGCKAAAEVCRGSLDVMDPYMEAFHSEAEKLVPK